MVQRRARGRAAAATWYVGTCMWAAGGPVLGHRRLRRGRHPGADGGLLAVAQPEAVQGLTEMQQFADRYVTFMEVNVSYDRDDIVTSVLMGKKPAGDGGAVRRGADRRQGVSSRSVGEPPDGKVLRGSHDGFIEAVVPNMAMLRRRIRDPHLTMEGLKVGQRTHSDVALCYLDDRVDHALLDELRHKLQNIQANSLTMAQESVAGGHPPQAVVQPLPKGAVH